MNRREAIAALTALPGLTSINRVDLKPDDVLVVECDGHLSAQGADNIRYAMQQIWPNHKVAILQTGLHLKVVRKEDA